MRTKYKEFDEPDACKLQKLWIEVINFNMLSLV